MPAVRLDNACIKGISAALPDNMLHIDSLKRNYSDDNIDKIVDAVGVHTLFRVKGNQTASDLCYAAAEKIIEQLKWDKNSVDGLLFISQTPDFIMPATSCVLQERLGLSHECLALDINLGCSGYIYGLFVAYQFIKTGACKRVLVLVGDTISKTLSEKDKGTALIFSDAGTATAIEYSEGEPFATFTLKCDGRGAESLIIRDGGFRYPMNTASESACEKDGLQPGQLYMNGMEIFSFAIREIPRILKETVNAHGWSINELDCVLLHQANKHMIQFIVKNAGIPVEKAPVNIEKYGNTSGASIPLLICDSLRGTLLERDIKVAMSGFGVGLSWGAAAMCLGKGLCCPDIIYV